VWNVTINLPELPDGERDDLARRARAASERADELHRACVEQVRRRLHSDTDAGITARER
jgi:hypothetical protein